MDVSFVNPFIRSAVEVFDTMAQIRCLAGKPYLKTPAARLTKLYQIRASVDLSGPVNGSVALLFSTSLALALASALAKDNIDAVNETALDALRETINMVAGAAKRELPGGLIKMGLPIVTMQVEQLRSSHVPAIMLPFDTNAGSFVVEVALRGMGKESAHHAA